MPVRTVTILASAALLAAAAPAMAGHAIPAVTFAQERSTFKADPNAIYGRLPNGMTYVIEHNATPAGTAAIQMRVRAGSMMETDAQKGLAHFVEHMAFEGTTHIKHGELKPMLERSGFAFGADANAFTTDSTTTYVLNAPKTDDTTLNQALFILREVAGNMTIDPINVESERGVILAEERLRDNPVSQRNLAFGRFLYPGLREADHSNPIGSVDIIKTAPAAELSRFYHTWYRPELTTLVIVGDFDARAMEKQVQAVFSDWKAATPAPDEPDWGVYQPKGPRVFSYTAIGLDREVAATWLRPLETRPESLERDTEAFQDVMLTFLLNRRYQMMAQSGEAQFVSAGLSAYENYKTTRNLVLDVTPKPGKTKEAFDQAWSVFHAFQAQGVTADDVAMLQSVIPTIRSNIEKGYATRDNGGITGGIIHDIDTDTVDLGLADELKAIDAMMPALAQDSLNAQLKVLFSGDGPVFTDYGTDSIADLPADAVLADSARISASQAEAYAQQTQKPWPYGDFGKPVAPATHTVDPDFGFGHYVFPNGVVLNVKSDTFTANQVLVQVAFGGGTERFDPKTPRPLPLLYSDLFVSGGLGKMDISDIQRTLAGKTASMAYSMSTARATLGGVTTTGDLDLQMQLLMAFATDPGLRGPAYARFQAYVPEYLRNLRATPGGVLGYELRKVTHPNDWRFDSELLAKAPEIAWGDVASLYRESLTDTPITITMAGDVDEAKAVAAVAATFATLPTRPAVAPRAADAQATHFPPAEHEFVFTHEGRADQNISLVLWPTADVYSDLQRYRGLGVLAGVLQNRLYDKLRESEGADYTPQVYSYADSDLPGYGYVQVSATIKVGDDPLFRTTLNTIVADLKAHPPTQDEITRVTAPILQDIETSKKTNGYWFGTLDTVAAYPGGRKSILDYADQIKAVDGAMLMTLARTWLKDDAEIHVTVKPDPKAAPAVAPVPAPAPAK